MQMEAMVQVADNRSATQPKFAEVLGRVRKLRCAVQSIGIFGIRRIIDGRLQPRWSTTAQSLEHQAITGAIIRQSF